MGATGDRPSAERNTMKKVIGKEDEADTVPSAPVTSVGGRGRAVAKSTNAEGTPIQNRIGLRESGRRVTGDDGTADRTDGCDGDDRTLAQGGQSTAR